MLITSLDLYAVAEKNK